MINEKIELGDNYYSITIKDVTDININEIIELAKIKKIKVSIEINTLIQLESFSESKIMDIKNIHISLIYTKQTFITQDITNIINNTLIKSLVNRDLRIYLDLYTLDPLSDSIVENNMKIIERLKYMNQDVDIHTKVYEILYQSNQILKAYKKNEDYQNNLRSKINKLQSYANKM